MRIDGMSRKRRDELLQLSCSSLGHTAKREGGVGGRAAASQHFSAAVAKNVGAVSIRAFPSERKVVLVHALDTVDDFLPFDGFFDEMKLIQEIVLCGVGFLMFLQ